MLRPAVAPGHYQAYRGGRSVEAIGWLAFVVRVLGGVPILLPTFFLFAPSCFWPCMAGGKVGREDEQYALNAFNFSRVLEYVVLAVPWNKL